MKVKYQLSFRNVITNSYNMIHQVFHSANATFHIHCSFLYFLKMSSYLHKLCLWCVWENLFQSSIWGDFVWLKCNTCHDNLIFSISFIIFRFVFKNLTGITLFNCKHRIKNFVSLSLINFFWINCYVLHIEAFYRMNY